MFAKLCTFALAALPLASALSFNSVSNGNNGGQLTITWTASSDDAPYFSLQLVNSAFNNVYAVANNVQTSLGSITISIPQVPDSAYELEAFATNNVQQVYATSNSFTIGNPSSSSSSAASSSESASSSSSASFTMPSTLSTASTTGTVSSPSVMPSSASLPSSSSSSSASSTPTPFNSSGAASFKLVGVAPAAALVLSAVAGAAMVF